MSTEHGVALVAHRWCDERNVRSDAYRHGTWYGVGIDAIARYRNADPSMRLGGATLITGTIRSHRPYHVDLPAHRVLHDAWDELPFGSGLRDIALVRERSDIRRLLKRMAPDPEDRARFARMPGFVIKTMLAERLAAAWCRDAGHDLLIVRVDGRISEIFDHQGAFRPLRRGGIDEHAPIGKTP